MHCRDAITYEPSDLWAWGSVGVKGLKAGFMRYATNFPCFLAPEDTFRNFRDLYSSSLQSLIALDEQHGRKKHVGQVCLGLGCSSAGSRKCMPHRHARDLVGLIWQVYACGCGRSLTRLSEICWTIMYALLLLM